MWRSIRAWLSAVDIGDPIEQSQAMLVQVMLIGLIGASILAVPLSVMGRASSVFFDIRMAALLLIVATAVVALMVVRRGRLRLGTLVGALGLVGALTVFGVLQGVLDNTWILLAMAIPVALVGLMLGRWTLVGVLVLITGVIGTLGLLEGMPGQLVGFAPGSSRSWSMLALSFLLIGGVLGVFFDRFSSMLRTALVDALRQASELEALRAGLEETVAARTAELQASVDQLQASQATIRELGAPVLPVLPGVLVAPLIGALDTARAADLSSTVLAAISRHRARHLILDITGVPVVDTHVARALLRVAEAARLLGAEPLLVGVRAEVAQTMVTLGVELGAVRVYPNLQEAIAALQEAPSHA